MPTCPVCAFPKLKEPPHSKSGGGSYEICPCCGFQFGVDDDDKGITFLQARSKWIESGMKWQSKSKKPPAKWDAQKQLATLEKTKPVKKKITKKAAKKTQG